VFSSQRPPKPLPELIKKAREVNSLTQAAFGKLFNPPVAQPTVARWEKGEQIPDRKHFPKIASLLNLKLEELFELVEGQLTNADRLPVLPNTQTYTPNQRHLVILNRGAIAWNRWREKNPEVFPQLAGANPRERDLHEIDLRDADLRCINFNAKSLRSARFDGSDLTEANLKEADLSNANLEGVDLRKANLTKANLSNANLKRADLREAVLYDAYLDRVNLEDANLSDADLTLAVLTRAILNGANLENAILKNCLVYRVSAWDVKLKGAVQKNLNICPYNVERIYVNDLRCAYIKSLEIANLEDSKICNTATDFQAALEDQNKSFKEKLNQIETTKGGEDEA
jgi:uncharacterized protein YjbI with pentapeptide repeats